MRSISLPYRRSGRSRATGRPIGMVGISISSAPEALCSSRTIWSIFLARGGRAAARHRCRRSAGHHAGAQHQPVRHDLRLGPASPSRSAERTGVNPHRSAFPKSGATVGKWTKLSIGGPARTDLPLDQVIGVPVQNSGLRLSGPSRSSGRRGLGRRLSYRLQADELAAALQLGGAERGRAHEFQLS